MIKSGGGEAAVLAAVDGLCSLARNRDPLRETGLAIADDADCHRASPLLRYLMSSEATQANRAAAAAVTATNSRRDSSMGLFFCMEGE